MDEAAKVRREAIRLGFDAVGFAAADSDVGVAWDRYREVSAEGFFSDLPYVDEHAEVRRRLDGPSILPGAKTVICLARRYHRDGDPEGGLVPHIARYARGRDYHNGLRKKLRQLAVFVRGLGEGIDARPMVDDVPVLERAWAARSGLGFIGKNGLLIIPGQGSFVLLGEVVTTLSLPAGDPLAERCGSCTRCLDACPTNAFPRPFVLDPRRCIATLTIERRTAAPLELRAAIDDHLFGCDDCQTVCPFNATRPPAAERTEMFAPLARWQERDLADLLRLDEATFARDAEGSPLFRATLPGLIRNAIVVAANTRRVDLRPLVALLTEHADPSVRELATWALAEMRLSDEAGT
jgi:epoxyqueuosine reductase